MAEPNKTINEFPQGTEMTTGDRMPYWDESDARTKYMLYEHFYSIVMAQALVNSTGTSISQGITQKAATDAIKGLFTEMSNVSVTLGGTLALPVTRRHTASRINPGGSFTWNFNGSENGGIASVIIDKETMNPAVPLTITLSHPDLPFVNLSTNAAGTTIDVGTGRFWEVKIIVGSDAIYYYLNSLASDINSLITAISNLESEVIDNLQEAKDYADSLVIGLLDDRGNYDVSSNEFPSTGGSGDAGALMKGDVFTAINGPGTLPDSDGQPMEVNTGDLIRVLVDSPGQTGSNWAITAREDRPYNFDASNKLVMTNHVTGDIEEVDNLEYVDAEKAFEVQTASAGTIPRYNLKNKYYWDKKASLAFSFVPGWAVTGNTGTAHPLHRISFKTASSGYAVGEGFYLLVTDNGGSTWGTINGRTSLASDVNQIYDIYWLSSTVGFILCERDAGPALYKTTNGGSSWSQIYSFTTSIDVIPGSKVLQVVDANTIYVAGWDSVSNALYRKSTDGGTTFSTAVNITGLRGCLSFRYFTFLRVIACGYNASGQGSISVGVSDSWSSAANFPSLTILNDCVLRSLTLAIAVGRTTGNVGAVVKSTDGGTSWGSPVEIAGTSNLQSVMMITDLVGFASGTSSDGYGVIYRTDDAGDSWKLNFKSTGGSLNGGAFASATKGIFIGQGTTGIGQGPIILTNTAGVDDSELKAFQDADSDDLMPMAVKSPIKSTHATPRQYVDDADALKRDKKITPVELVSGANIALTGPKHTLTTDLAAIAFTIPYTGDDIEIEVVLNAAESVFTFPAVTTYCMSNGEPSGNNTCTLSGVAGDRYIITIGRFANYTYVFAVNMLR